MSHFMPYITGINLKAENTPITDEQPNNPTTPVVIPLVTPKTEGVFQKNLTTISMEKVPTKDISDTVKQYFNSTLANIHENPAFLLEIDLHSAYGQFACVALYQLIVKGNGIDKEDEIKECAKKILLTDAQQIGTSYDQILDLLNSIKAKNYCDKTDSVAFLLICMDPTISEELIKGEEKFSAAPTIFKLHQFNTELAKECIRIIPSLLLKATSQALLTCEEFKKTVFELAARKGVDIFVECPFPKKWKAEFCNSFDWMMKAIDLNPADVLDAGDKLKEKRQEYILLLKNSLVTFILDKMMKSSYKQFDILLEDIKKCAKEVMPVQSSFSDPKIFLGEEKEFKFNPCMDHLSTLFKNNYTISYDDFLEGLETFRKEGLDIISQAGQRYLAMLDVRAFVMLKMLDKGTLSLKHCLQGYLGRLTAAKWDGFFDQLAVQLHNRDKKVIDCVTNYPDNRGLVYYFVDNSFKMGSPSRLDMRALTNVLYEKYKDEALNLPGFPREILDKPEFWYLVEDNILLSVHAGENLRKNSDFLSKVLVKLKTDPQDEKSPSDELKSAIEKMVKEGLGEKVYQEQSTLIDQYIEFSTTGKGNPKQFLSLDALALREMNLAKFDMMLNLWLTNQKEMTWKDGTTFHLTPMAILEYNRNKEVVQLGEKIIEKKKYEEQPILL